MIFISLSTASAVAFITFARVVEILVHAVPESHQANGSSLSLARAIYSGIFSTSPISPACERGFVGPAMGRSPQTRDPAATQANGLAPEDPARRTSRSTHSAHGPLEDEILSRAFSITGLTT